MTTTSRRIAMAPAAIVLAGLGWLASGPPGTAPRPHPLVLATERPPAPPARYWTRARMAAARDVSARPDLGSSRVADTEAGIGWTGGGAVARSAGRVFFTLNGSDYSCSGSAVASANASVVITAGHCVSDGAGRWATHWIFVPGYRDGRQPYGTFPARRFFAAPGWTRHGYEADDVAFVVVGTARVDGSARTLTATVPGQRIGFGIRGMTETAFGYPSDAPYHGRMLDYCAGMLFDDPYGSPDTGLNCSMTEGASGGPWFTGFDARTGRGTITGVTAFRYANNSLTLYAADLGQTAKALYEKAQHAKV